MQADVPHVWNINIKLCIDEYNNQNLRQPRSSPKPAMAKPTADSLFLLPHNALPYSP